MEFKLGPLRLERLRLDNLYASYLGLSPREQTFSLIGLGILPILAIFVPISLASSSLTSLEKNIVEEEKNLKQMMRGIETHNEMKSKMEAMERTFSTGFDSSIASTLESIANKAGIKARIDSLKEKNIAPSDLYDETSVDVRLKRILLSELISFLYEIENHPQKILRLSHLEIKPRFDSKQELDVSFSVSSFRLRENNEEGEGS